jgi:hypothetical protein
MANFTKLDENNIVIEVIVVANNTLDPSNEEISGIAFLTQWSGGYFNWKQTSYNGNIRYNYAGVGYTYDAVNDAFIAPKPYPSWLLDSNFNWQPPTPRPVEGLYTWDEENQQWQILEN